MARTAPQVGSGLPRVGPLSTAPSWGRQGIEPRLRRAGQNVAVVAADPYLLLAAIGAPFVAGLLTLALPRSATGTRVLLAVAGPVATLVLVAIHVTDEGVAAATEATGRRPQPGGGRIVPPWRHC